MTTTKLIVIMILGIVTAGVSLGFHLSQFLKYGG